MSTDLERELRELFRDKAGDAPVAAPHVDTGTPQPVLRRARRHQIATVAGSAAIAFAIAAGSVAGLGALLRGGDVVGGRGDYEVFRRDARIEAFSLSSPSDWFLVNEWPRSIALASGGGSASKTCTVGPSGTETCTEEREPVDPIHPSVQGLPLLQLTNVDLGLASNICRDGLPSGGAALYIALDPASTAGNLDPFPPGPMPGLPEPSSEGPCGAGSYSRFTVNGYPMFSWVAWDAIVSDQDRATVQRTWEQMWAHDDWQPSRPQHGTAAYVLAGGGPIDHEWRLELRPSPTNVELTLIGATPSVALPGVTVPDEPIEWCCGDQLTDPIFGAITKEATGVEFRPGTENTSYDLGGSPVPGTIVPLPPTMGSFDFDLFFIDPPSGYADLGGHVMPLGLDQQPPEPSPDTAPRTDEVELSGTDFGRSWFVRFTGAFADDSACIDVRIEAATYDRPLCLKRQLLPIATDGPSMDAWLTDDLYLTAGSVPTNVQSIEFESDDGTSPLSTLICQMGPQGWTAPDRRVCVATFPPQGSGRLRYLGADGSLLFEEGIGWGVADAISTIGERAVAEGTICGNRWSLTRIDTERGFGTYLDWGTGHALSEDVDVLGKDTLPLHWTPMMGCTDPAEAATAPDWITFGLVSRRADSVWVLSGGEVRPASVATDSGEGPFVFWAILRDASPRGEIVALSGCEVIGRGTFSTEDEPPPSPAQAIAVADCAPIPG